MKKFLTRLVLFALFMAIFYVFAIGITGTVQPAGIPNLPYFKGSYGHLFTRSHEAVQFSGVDILVMGSSRAYRGFDPRIFDQHGLQIFNFGSSAQSPIQSYYLARQYLDTLDPELVVIEVFPEGFASDGVESALDFLANKPIDGNSVKMAFEINHVKVYNVLVLALVREWLGMDHGFKEALKRDYDTYISGGFVEKSSEFPPRLSTAPNPREIQFKDFQKEAFANLLELLRKKQIDYILVEAPTTRARYDATTNHPEIESFLHEHGPYVNFNERLSLVDSLHFYDHSHLNQHGVEIFNGAFIEWLKEEGFYERLRSE